MTKPYLHLPLWDLAGGTVISNEFWRVNAGGGWATAVVLVILLSWHLLRSFSRWRAARVARDWAAKDISISPSSSLVNSSLGIAKIISDADLRELINDLDGKLDEKERWEDVINKKNHQLSYGARCCRLKDGLPKYLSVTTFEGCSTELLRDFYMDNEYRTEWDSTVIKHEQLQFDEASGTEIGRTIKKFPLLTPREYILAWRVWEGNDKTYYCFIKDCEHSLAPLQKKYVRVGFFRSGWCIRKVPGRDASEIIMVHQEDNGMNIEMAKLAFAKGIWSYVCKMNNALRVYSSRGRNRSKSILTMRRLIQKVPVTIMTGGTNQGLPEASGGSSIIRQSMRGSSDKEVKTRPSKKWIANGLLLLGGIVCLSRGRSALGTQLAVACILKKLMRQGPESGQTKDTQLGQVRHKRRNYG
ncbi:uncharacterized protein [Typha angustifolia]|uniref:uncharacterized protein n=1 Tax=Typha angustifolia TaxID=59011 RepID=UPI003C2CC3A5